MVPPIELPQSEARDVLRLAVRFYGAQRCGDGHNWLLSDNASGDTCHLEDGPALEAGRDLTGGWHDAGDFIKFTLTQAWASYALLKSYETFGGAFEDRDGPTYGGAPNGVPDLLDEVLYATDYLVKTHPDSSTLIHRVGGNQDHDLWVTSPYQSMLSVDQGGGARPVFTGGQADVAGMVAASLALMSRMIAPHDTARAAEYLTVARSVYALGKANPGTTPDNYYPNPRWQDKMLCGAVELYRATGEDAFLTDARGYDAAIGSQMWVLDWSNTADPCRHSLHLAGDPDALGRLRADVDRYLTAVSTDTHVAGMAFFGNWGSLRYAMNAAFSAALLHDATGEALYRDFALSQLAYVLGDNEHGRSFVVGFGANPPTRPHHKNAHGHEALDWNRTAAHQHVLAGALVGGPTREAIDEVSPAGYADDILDYVGNEVTIDYGVGLVGTAAFSILLGAEPASE